MKKEIPFWEKSNLTIEEAAAYFNIGINKLHKLVSDEKCPYALWVGNKCLIKKRALKSTSEKRIHFDGGKDLKDKTSEIALSLIRKISGGREQSLPSFSPKRT